MSTRLSGDNHFMLRILWLAALMAIISYLTYKLHDLREAFSFGHARWADSYIYWFARSHLDLGLTTTLGLNVEGVTATGAPIFYLSAPPLGALPQAFMVSVLGGEPWTVRVLPLIMTLCTSALIAVLSYRLRGAYAAPIAILVFAGIPFVLEYGSSNEGFLVFALAFGLLGYLAYQRFIESGRLSHLYLSAACFTLGLGINWMSGFMALSMLVHLWFQPVASRMKSIATVTIVASITMFTVILLLQQGLATGEFLYPFKRALARASTPDDTGISWSVLLNLQMQRYWNYYGPVVSMLSIYWLARRILPRLHWDAADTWIIVVWTPGLVYSLILRDAAYNHDFLMLGLLPGTVLMATSGLLTLIDDLGRIKNIIYFNKWVPFAAGFILLGLHAIIAVRSAQNFENQERQDLTHGAARIAPYLRNLMSNDILVSDWSVSMASRVDPHTRERYASLWPFIDYMIRRPVRVIMSLEELHSLMCDAKSQEKNVVLIQQSKGNADMRGRIVEGLLVQQLRIPDHWIKERHVFDQVSVLHLVRPHDKECHSTPTSHSHHADAK